MKSSSAFTRRNEGYSVDRLSISGSAKCLLKIISADNCFFSSYGNFLDQPMLARETYNKNVYFFWHTK